MSLLATSADVTKIKDKDPLSGTNEVNGDVMERCFFHADCWEWPLVKWLVAIWLLLTCVMWFVFYLFGSMLPKLVAPHACKTMSVNGWFLGALEQQLCQHPWGPSPFQISKICSRLHFKILLLSIVYVTVTIRVNYLYWFLFMVYELFLWGSFVRISILAKMYR